MTEMTEIKKDVGVRRPATDHANRQISSKLRQLYDSVREQEIPERFLDLLERLDEAERAAGSDTSRESTPHGQQ